jgi:hypothetical protein
MTKWIAFALLFSTVALGQPCGAQPPTPAPDTPTATATATSTPDPDVDPFPFGTAFTCVETLPAAGPQGIPDGAILCLKDAENNRALFGVHPLQEGVVRLSGQERHVTIPTNGELSAAENLGLMTTFVDEYHLTCGDPDGCKVNFAVPVFPLAGVVKGGVQIRAVVHGGEVTIEPDAVNKALCPMMDEDDVYEATFAGGKWLQTGCSRN